MTGPIAVVGGRGVIGRGIVDALRAAGHTVWVVTHDRSVAAADGFRYGDLHDDGSLVDAFRDVDVVIQTATFPTYPIEKPRRGHTFMEFDGVGTERGLAAAVMAGVRRYIYISGVRSAKGAEKPYFLAIERGERAVLASPVEGVCLAPTLVYGPHDKGLNRLLRVTKWSPVLPIVGRGDELHQPVFIDDLGSVAVRAVAPDAPTGRFEVGGPERVTLRQFLRLALEMVGRRRIILPLPVGPTRLAAQVLERLPGSLVTASAIDFVTEDFVADLDPAMSAFGLSPTPLDEGLSTYISRQHRSRQRTS